MCKSIYYASHTRALWAYLLRKSDPASLPPLPPVSEIGPLEQGVPASLSALAIERIVVRGASLRANFACPHPRPFRIWAQETFAYVQDVALLPGSDHLVAIQQDMTTKVSSMVLYKLDCAHDAEAMVAVPLSGQPVIGTLQAKYMTVNGVLGLTVACIQKLRDPAWYARSLRRCPPHISLLSLFNQWSRGIRMSRGASLPRDHGAARNSLPAGLASIPVAFGDVAGRLHVDRDACSFESAV